MRSIERGERNNDGEADDERGEERRINLRCTSMSILIRHVRGRFPYNIRLSIY